MNKVILFLALFLLISTRRAYAEAEYIWVNSNLDGRINNLKVPDLKQDFYLSQNYNWLKDSKLQPGHSRNSAFDELNDQVMKNLIGLASNKNNNLTGHDADLVKNLYSLWLNWDLRNSEGMDQIDRYINLIENIKNIDELNSYFKSKECLYHGNFIFDVSLGHDNKDSSSYNVEIISTSLMLGDSAEYKNLTENGKREKIFREAIGSYMLRRLGYSEDEANKILNASFEFEKSISDYMMSHEKLNSPEAVEKLYNPVNMNDIKINSKNFPLAEILQAHKINSKLTNLQEPEWLKGLNKIYNNDNLENIKAYLIRKTASEYITLIDEPAFREYQRLLQERNGINNSRPDEELAIEFLRKNIPVPLSKLYVKKFVSEKTKHEIENIINQAINYYRSMLASINWLSDETKNKAVEKLNALTPRAAYPDKWKDYTDLKINSIENNETLLKAHDKIKLFKLKLFYSRLNTKVDKELWIDDVTQVNAYYSPSKNEIMIIAGILGGVFYNPEMSQEEKLGRIGAVIGHEISHAFDTIGAQFDKNGNMLKWWSDEDYKAFKLRADKLINYMSGFKVTPEGENYNGSLVQFETIADMAGVKCMLGIANNYKNFDYDKFFKSYAEIWKLKQTRERLDFVLKIDVHALPYLRVNAVLQQYEKFHQTYGIKNGDKMYLTPEDRVNVW